MRQTRNWVRLLVTALLLVAGTVGLTGTAAAADNMPGKPPSSCPGHVIWTKPKNVAPGKKLTLQVYYSSARGGTNCAIARKSGSWYNKPTFLSVIIWKSSKSPDHSWPDAAWDQDNYKKFAGAAYITGTKGKCITVIAYYGLHKNDIDGDIPRSHFACG